MPFLEGQDEKLRSYSLQTKDGRFLLPWERLNINMDFLRHEQKRIKEIAVWRDEFDRSPEGSRQKEVDLYVVPVEMNPALRAAVSSMGDCAIRGLSALRSSAAGLLVGLFPRSENVPRDYSYIHIMESKRSVIAEPRQGLIEYALLVDHWEYSDPVLMYSNIDYEKGILSKIINEKFQGDRQLALSLQAPVFSAPYVQGGMGGISFSSFTRKNELMDELEKTFQLTVPPEFRIMRPPAVLYNGSRFHYSDQLVFKLAERPAPSGHALSMVNTENYLQVRKQYRKREGFPGEYSVFSMIHTSTDKSPSVVKEMLYDFNRTEVTFPKDLENEMFMEDVQHVRKSISEDVWLQNVAVRGMKPGFDSTRDVLFQKYADLLWQDFDSRLTDQFKGESDRAVLVSSIVPTDNFKRLVQSVGRMDETESLTEDHFKAARGLILDNFSGFAGSKEIINQSDRLRKRQADLRFTSVETVLADKQYWTVEDIYKRLVANKIFRDLADLQGLLEWGRKNGYVIRDGLDRYRWVGIVK